MSMYFAAVGGPEFGMANWLQDEYDNSRQQNQPPTAPQVATVTPEGGNAAPGLRTAGQAGISANDALRIQNAADKTGQTITVIGSRAAGTVGPQSDWDYIFSGPSAARHSAASSVPAGDAGGAMGASTWTGRDIFQSYNPAAPGYKVVDPERPHVIFTPKR